jgi:hypothetical protein
VTKAEANQFYRLPSKTIVTDIRFAPKSGHPSLLVAEGIEVGNSLNWKAKLSIHFNPDEDSKIVNMHVDNEKGAICRLCVDNQPHWPCGRSHKHFVMTPDCPRQNLPSGVSDRPDLSGKTLREVFDVFCELTFITFSGEFYSPPV